MAKTRYYSPNDQHNPIVFGTPPNSDTLHNTLYSYSYQSRSGSRVHKGTTDNMTIGPGITEHWRHSNGNGCTINGSDVTELRYLNELIKIVLGGNFTGTNGCKVESSDGPNKTRAASSSKHFSKIGSPIPGDPNGNNKDGTIRESCDGASCRVVPGDHGDMYAGVYGVMSAERNVGSSGNYNAGAGGSMQLASMKNFGITSAAGAVNLCAALGMSLDATTTLSINGWAGACMYSLAGISSVSDMGGGGLAVGKGTPTVLNGPGGAGIVLINSGGVVPFVPTQVSAIGPPGNPAPPTIPVT